MTKIFLFVVWALLTLLVITAVTELLTMSDTSKGCTGGGGKENCGCRGGVQGKRTANACAHTCRTRTDVDREVGRTIASIRHCPINIQGHQQTLGCTVP